MPAANVALLDAPLPIVRDPGLARPQIGDQLVQFGLVLALWAFRFQPRHRAHNVAVPQAPIQPAQEPSFGCLAFADSTAELVAFLLEVMPVEEHCLVLEISKGLRKEVPDPA